MIKPAGPKIPATALTHRVDGYGHATFRHEYATAFSVHTTIWCWCIRACLIYSFPEKKCSQQNCLARDRIKNEHTGLTLSSFVKLSLTRVDVHAYDPYFHALIFFNQYLTALIANIL
jgi:hypothetical protein